MTSKTEMTPPDVFVENHISVVLVRPLNDAMEQWLREHTLEESTWMGGCIVVEPRYLDALVEGMRSDGWEVR